MHITSVETFQEENGKLFTRNVIYKQETLDVFVRPTWKDLIVHAGQFKDM